MELRTETYKRKQPPQLLFFLGIYFSLPNELLSSPFKNIWLTISVSLGVVTLMFTFLEMIDRVKGWYYTKWLFFILVFIIGVSIHIFYRINGE
ncbi:hypothetical protein ACQKL5_06165 [Peribacillus sp. NPDC097675]|uniref:hypothetical protein n=1 Tax=Peribacillus sp. NPDC097675 TaxID=3390618 RepID=UPI003D0488C4